MHIFLTRSFLLFCLFLPVMSQAQDAPDMLALAPGFTPAASFTETYSDPAVYTTYRILGDTTYVYSEWRQTPKSTFTVKITANIKGIVLADIDDNTLFAFSIGGVSADFLLGDDLTYRRGKTSAFFPSNFDEMGKPFGTNGVHLSWNARTLTVTLTGSMSDTDPLGGVLAESFVGMAVPKIHTSIDATINFEAFSGSRTLFVQGNSAFRPQVQYGSGASLQFYDVSTVTLNGAADFTAPTVTVTSPKNNANPAAGTSVTFTGKAADEHALSRVEWTSDEETLGWSTIATYGGDDWGPASQSWDFVLPPLESGTTKVWVRSVDSSNNISKPVLINLLKPLPADLTGRWDCLVTGESVDDPYGFITFACDAKGTVSGKLTMERTAAACPFTGVWYGNVVSAKIKRGKLPPLRLTGFVYPQTEEGSDPSVVAGWLEVDDDGGISPFANWSGFRCGFSAKNPVPATGVGRINCQTEGGIGQGSGYFSVVIQKTGAAGLAGRLRDGTTWTFSTVLSGNGQLTLFLPMYGNQGSLSSQMEIDLNAKTLFGSLRRCYPSRPYFDGDKAYSTEAVNSVGEEYLPPVAKSRILNLAAGTLNASAKLSGDGIEEEFLQQFLTISDKNTISVTDASHGFKGTIATATGIVTGSFTLPGTHITASFSAMVVGDKIWGHWIAPPPSGYSYKQYGSITIQSAISP